MQKNKNVDNKEAVDIISVKVNLWENKGPEFFNELEKWITNEKGLIFFICDFIQPFSEIIYARTGSLRDKISEFEDSLWLPITKDDFLMIYF